jgi:hypothetical protein
MSASLIQSGSVSTGPILPRKPLPSVMNRRGVGDAAPEHFSHGQRDVTLEFRLGHTGRLEVLPIEIGDAAFAQAFQWPAAAAEGWGHAEAGDLGEHVRAEHRRMPGDRRAPIMTDNDRLLLAERRDQRDHVADIVDDAVGVDLRRRSAAAKTAHVGGDDVETRRRDRRDLMPPGIGQFRPAMAEHHQRTLTLLAHEQLDPVSGNCA